MALLARAHLNALVSIELRDSRNRYRSIATGFLIGFIFRNSKDPAKRRYRIFLVTNRHVFRDKAQVFLRFNRRGGGVVRFPVSLIVNGQTKWLDHTDPKVDIALLTINPQVLEQHGVEWKFFNEEMIAYARKFGLIGIELGDEVFVFGFPLSISGNLQNYPIVRGGVIARADREILSAQKFFLVDSSIFPGNSGSPVLSKPEIVSVDGTPPVNQIYLLGVVAGHIVYKEPLYSHQSEPPTHAGYAVENSHLANVVPMDFAKQIYRRWIRTKKRLEGAQQGTEKAVEEESKKGTDP